MKHELEDVLNLASNNCAASRSTDRVAAISLIDLLIDTWDLSTAADKQSVIRLIRLLLTP